MLRPKVYHEIVGLFNPRATVKKHCNKINFLNVKKNSAKKIGRSAYLQNFTFCTQKSESHSHLNYNNLVLILTNQLSGSSINVFHPAKLIPINITQSKLTIVPLSISSKSGLNLS